MTTGYLREDLVDNQAAVVTAQNEKPVSIYTVRRHECLIHVIAHTTESFDRSLLADEIALADLIDLATALRRPLLRGGRAHAF